jgi:hypothetical protein
MVHIHSDLLVSFVFLWVLPKVGKGRLKQTSADAVCIRYVIPLLFASFEDLVEVWPLRYVCLHVEDTVFASGERVEIRRRFEISDENLCP